MLRHTGVIVTSRSAGSAEWVNRQRAGGSYQLYRQRTVMYNGHNARCMSSLSEAANSHTGQESGAEGEIGCWYVVAAGTWLLPKVSRCRRPRHVSGEKYGKRGTCGIIAGTGRRQCDALER